MRIVAAASVAATRFTKAESKPTPASDSIKLHTSASRGVINARGSGRSQVRCINASVRRSHHWFRESAPHAESEVPSSVAARIGPVVGPAAVKYAVIVVRTDIAVSRGLVKATKALARVLHGRGT